MVDLVPPADPDALEVRVDCTHFGAEIIDLDGVRIQFGVRKARGSRCEHRNMLYSREESRVWCKDCDRTIENFDAFMTLVTHFQDMSRAARRKMEKADEAEKASINRRAAKEIDRAWSGNCMAISCPHCAGGLLPEDFERGVGQRSREMELARRKKANPNA